MKWLVHDHVLYDSSPSQHTEEQQQVSLVTALSSSLISFTPPLSSSKPSISHHPSSHPESCPMFAFILPNSYSFSPTQLPVVCVNMANCVCMPLFSPFFYRGIISRYALWRKAQRFYSMFTSSFPISPSILSDRQCLYFFSLYRPSAATFTIQYQPPTFTLRQ